MFKEINQYSLGGYKGINTLSYMRDTYFNYNFS